MILADTLKKTKGYYDQHSNPDVLRVVHPEPVISLKHETQGLLLLFFPDDWC